MLAIYDTSANYIGTPSSGFGGSMQLAEGAGNDRIVLVGVALVASSTPTIEDMTFAGEDMTHGVTITTDEYFNITTVTYIYFMLDEDLPSSSGTYTVDFETASGPSDGVMLIGSWYDVNQVTPNFGGSQDADEGAFAADTPYDSSLTLSSSAGRLIDFGAIAWQKVTQTPGSGQTKRAEAENGWTALVMSDKAFTASGATSMSEEPDDEYYAYAHALAELETAPDAADNAPILGANF